MGEGSTGGGGSRSGAMEEWDGDVMRILTALGCSFFNERGGFFDESDG